MKRYNRLCLYLSVFIAAVIVVAVAFPVLPVSAQNFAKFPVGWVIAKKLQVSGTTTLTGAVTASNSSNAITIGSSADLSSPPAIGGTTPNTGAFSTLSASGVLTASNAANVVRIGTSSDLTTPPAIGGTTPNAGSFSTLSASGLATLSGNVTSASANTKELAVDASIAFTPYSSTLTVTEGYTINPYRPFVALTAAGAVSTSATTAIVDGWNDGQILTLINSGANAITIKNNANTILGGDIVLGQYDTLSVWWDGYNWIRYANANN